MFVDEVDTTIDVMKDSVQDAFRKLMTRAYGGTFPEGGWEPPANVMMGRCDEERADFTVIVDLTEGNDFKELSVAELVVPPVRKGEPIPKKSQSPFTHPFHDDIPTGMFGRALNAHSKLVSVLDSLDVPTKDADYAFKSQWGVPQNRDLSAFQVGLRSTGPAMYGGIGRKTVPLNALTTSSQTIVKVIDRHTERRALSDRALLDWPRAKTIAHAITTQLVTDDQIARGHEITLHFRLHRREIPQAPQEIVFPIIPELKQTNSQVVNAALGAISQQMRTHMVVQQQAAKYVISSALMPSNVIEAVRVVPRMITPKIETRITELPVLYNEFSDFTSSERSVVDDEDNIGEPEPAQLMQGFTQAQWNIMQKVRPVDVLKCISYSVAKRKRGSVPRAKLLREWMARMDQDPDSVRAEIEACVHSVYPDDVLLQVYQMGNLFSKQTGIYWTQDVKRYLRLGHSAFSEYDLKRVWKAGLDRNDVLLRIAEETAAGFTHAEYELHGNPTVNDYIAKKLAHPTSFICGLSKLVRAHAVYWHNRYLAESLHDKETKLKRQQAAKAMLAVQLVYTRDHNLVVRHEPLSEALIDSWCNYAAKRRTFKVVINYNVTWPPRDYLGLGVHLDNLTLRYSLIPPSVTWAETAKFIHHEMQLFLSDFKTLLARFYTHEDLPVPATYGKQKPVEVKLWDPDEIVEVVEPIDVFPIQHIDQDLPQNVPEGGAGLTEDDLFADLEAPADTRIDLVEELKEDGIKTDTPYARSVIDLYPKLVPVGEYNAIKAEILRRFAVNH